MSVDIVDQLGYPLNFKNRPKRVVSLVPSISEALAAYEPSIELLGVTRFCTHPAHLRKTKEIIGGTKDIDVDRILSLQPDVVIANKEENGKAAVVKLKTQVPVFISDIKNADDAIDLFQKLEHLFYVPKEKQIAFEVEKTTKRIKPFLSGSAAYIIWKDPLMHAGNDTFINFWLEKIGLKNFSKDNRYPEISSKSLRNKNPDYIFLSSEPYPFKEKNLKEFQEEFPNSKVALVDGRMFSWYGTAILETEQYFERLKNQLSG